MATDFIFGVDDLVSLYGGVFYLPGHPSNQAPAQTNQTVSAPHTPENHAQTPQEDGGVTKFSLKDVIKDVPRPVAPTPTPPERQAPPTAPVPTYTVTWHAKRNGRITFLLSDTEFADKSLTELLKNITVKGLEIPAGLVCFGKVSGVTPLAELANMPTNLGLIFGQHVVQLPTGHTGPLVGRGGRKLFVVPSLAEMNASREKKLEGWEVMKQFKPEIITD